MKPIFNRLLSGLLSASVLLSYVPNIPANAEDSNEPYPYTMFVALSDEGAITVNADNFCVNGNVEDELPMTLSLYNVNSSGSVIDSYYHWMPDEEQWWITGFVPDIYDYSVKEDELIQIASVDLTTFYDYSNHKNKVFEDLKDMYEEDSRYINNLIFDSENQLIWLVW